MSKDFGTASLRLGSLITRNDELRAATSANTTFHCPPGPSVAVGPAILEDQDFVRRFMEKSRKRLLQAREYVTKRGLSIIRKRMSYFPSSAEEESYRFQAAISATSERRLQGC